MSKKKICFIAQFPPPIHGLSKAVETLYNSKLNEIYDFEKIDITNNKNFLINLLKIFKSNADLFYFTISQTKGGNLRDLIIMKVLALQNKKCLIHLHGGYYRKMVDNDLSKWQKRANYNAIGKLEGAIVLSDSLRSIFKGMMPDEKIHVVMNCVDIEFLPPYEKLVEKMHQPKEILHVLYLSNFIRTKGYPIVLEMAKLEKERVDRGAKQRYYFDFAGNFFEKEEKKFFEKYIEEHRLYNYVTYHGVVGGEEKIELLNQCHIFALPTRYPNEGQPISILEAMGNGMYILTTDHAGIRDVVEDAINGAVIAGENITAQKYIDRLDGLSMAEFEKIGLANAKLCRYNFAEQKYIEEMRKVFD